eukprot:Platyproteum_vivax@DN7409_c0_g1_i3.p1
MVLRLLRSLRQCETTWAIDGNNPTTKNADYITYIEAIPEGTHLNLRIIRERLNNGSYTNSDEFARDMDCLFTQRLQHTNSESQFHKSVDSAYKWWLQYGATGLSHFATQDQYQEKSLVDESKLVTPQKYPNQLKDKSAEQPTCKVKSKREIEPRGTRRGRSPKKGGRPETTEMVEDTPIKTPRKSTPIKPISNHKSPSTAGPLRTSGTVDYNASFGEEECEAFSLNGAELKLKPYPHFFQGLIQFLNMTYAHKFYDHWHAPAENLLQHTPMDEPIGRGKPARSMEINSYQPDSMTNTKQLASLPSMLSELLYLHLSFNSYMYLCTKVFSFEKKRILLDASSNGGFLPILAVVHKAEYVIGCPHGANPDLYLTSATYSCIFRKNVDMIRQQFPDLEFREPDMVFYNRPEWVDWSTVLAGACAHVPVAMFANFMHLKEAQTRLFLKDVLKLDDLDLLVLVSRNSEAVTSLVVQLICKFKRQLVSHKTLQIECANGNLLDCTMIHLKQVNS